MRRATGWRELRVLGVVALCMAVGFCLPASGLPAATPPTVIIDPGHGGQDGGATESSDALKEKDLTLALARKLAEVLESEGVARVLLTRKEDQTLGLDERAGFANNRGGDLLISVHVGNSFRPSALGFSLYYWSAAFRDPVASPTPGPGALWENGQLPYWKQSRRLARLLERELRQSLPWPSGGLIEADIYLLRRATMPAVLLELGSINYPPEAADLAKPSFQEAVARAVAEAMRRFPRVRVLPPAQ
jgi:N-acetylmuramoyl-L-alanine amidase